MADRQFWTFLATSWSRIQGQAANTQFDSALLEKTIQAQISSAKSIRNNHYRNDDFLAYADDDDDLY